MGCPLGDPFELRSAEMSEPFRGVVNLDIRG
jgi:hypothetical protein